MDLKPRRLRPTPVIVLWAATGLVHGCNGPRANQEEVARLCTEIDRQRAIAKRHREASVAALESALHGLAIAQKEQAKAKELGVPPEPHWWRPAWTDLGKSRGWCQASRDADADVVRLAQAVDRSAPAKGRAHDVARPLESPVPTLCTDAVSPAQLDDHGASWVTELKAWGKVQAAAEDAVASACRGVAR